MTARLGHVRFPSESRHSSGRASLYYFFVVIVVIRYKTTAAARWALLLIVRTFFNDAITIAVRTSFHVCLSRQSFTPTTADLKNKR
jgi:hypothetical protein